jgi:AcrR family transcriptional regulator
MAILTSPTAAPGPTDRPSRPVQRRAASARAIQAEQTRRQILDTAQRLFAERGYDATSLQMIADELGLTKAAVYYHFHAKSDILHAVMLPGIQRVEALLDDALTMRGRRARIEHLVNGFVDFLVGHRHFAVMASGDPAMKRHKSEHELAAMRGRVLNVLFGDNPTGADRLAFHLVFSIPDSLPDLVDLTDEQLRDALQATLSRILRIPA